MIDEAQMGPYFLTLLICVKKAAKEKKMFELNQNLCLDIFLQKKPPNEDFLRNRKKPQLTNHLAD